MDFKMVTQKQLNQRQEKENMKLLSSHFKIGEDFILDGMYGEVVELLPTGNILIEFPNRTRRIVTKSELTKGGFN